jgi:alkylation response protein AidB-like acyl-CoA dehydrogenase
MSDLDLISRFLDNFRDFCRKEVSPYEGENPQIMDKALFQKLGKIGYLGLLHEEEFGGMNLGVVGATQVMEVLGEVSGGVFLSGGASAGLFGLSIKHLGTLEQKKKYLPSIISGDKIGCLGVTEPDSGSDVSAISTTVKEGSDGIYRLSGQKTYITNAPYADYALVLARFQDKMGKDKGLTHFVVDLSISGIDRSKPMKKMGLETSATGALYFDQAEIGGEETVLGRLGKGFRQTMETFNLERLSLAAWSLGLMNACVKESQSFSKSRKSFGKSILQHQSVGNLLAEMMTKTEATRAFTYQVAKEIQDKEEANESIMPLSARCAMVKLFATESAREVANLAVQIHGGAGYMSEYAVSRYYRDIRLAEIGGGTSEIQKRIIVGA